MNIAKLRAVVFFLIAAILLLSSCACKTDSAKTDIQIEKDIKKINSYLDSENSEDNIKALDLIVKNDISVDIDMFKKLISKFEDNYDNELLIQILEKFALESETLNNESLANQLFDIAFNAKSPEIKIVFEELGVKFATSTQVAQMLESINEDEIINNTDADFLNAASDNLNTSLKIKLILFLVQQDEPNHVYDVLGHLEKYVRDKSAELTVFQISSIVKLMDDPHFDRSLYIYINRNYSNLLIAAFSGYINKAEIQDLALNLFSNYIVCNDLDSQLIMILEEAGTENLDDIIFDKIKLHVDNYGAYESFFANCDIFEKLYLQNKDKWLDALVYYAAHTHDYSIYIDIASKEMDSLSSGGNEEYVLSVEKIDYILDNSDDNDIMMLVDFFYCVKFDNNDRVTALLIEQLDSNDETIRFLAARILDIKCNVEEEVFSKYFDNKQYEIIAGAYKAAEKALEMELVKDALLKKGDFDMASYFLNKSGYDEASVEWAEQHGVEITFEFVPVN